MILVRPSCVPASVAAEIARLAPVQTVIIGGTGSVGVSVESLTPC
jgi:hypothetical protein